MQIAARYSAAIDILDEILSGTAAEPALSRWARSNRYAGSKDRAAIRDLVFDVLRNRASFAHHGGALTGRGLIAGCLVARDQEIDDVFSGLKFCPNPLSDSEQEHLVFEKSTDEAVYLDYPDWQISHLKDGLGSNFVDAALAMKERAAIGIRPNLGKSSQKELIAIFEGYGMSPSSSAISKHAVLLPPTTRGLRNVKEFQEGFFEFQDASVQAVIETMELNEAESLLDYCAGGGGKSLALAAAYPELSIDAHDANPDRMNDLGVRAKRAARSIQICKTVDPDQHYDAVLLDVPCSGSGTAARQPEAKWNLDQSRLDELLEIQRQIIKEGIARLKPGGSLFYMTCSVFKCENSEQVAWAVKEFSDLMICDERLIVPTTEHCGFYSATLKKAEY